MAAPILLISAGLGGAKEEREGGWVNRPCPAAMITGGNLGFPLFVVCGDGDKRKAFSWHGEAGKELFELKAESAR